MSFQRPPVEGLPLVSGGVPKEPTSPTPSSNPQEHGREACPKAAGKSTARSLRSSLKVAVGDVQIGGSSFVIIAGPCAVESETQLLEAARVVAFGGAHMLRGGAFKPRTSPYSFQGLGRRGLELLVKARRKTGLPVVSEVLNAADVHFLEEYVDVLQIGARNMQNFELLRAVGQVRKPVILKRGMSATIEEWLAAAEYILLEGNPRVILCERGIRTYERYTRNTLDLSSVPIVKALSHLPVIVDPSHGTGRTELVIPMAKAAMAAGADGIMVEVHPKPESALSDGDQSLTALQFRLLVAELKALAPVLGRFVPASKPKKKHSQPTPAGLLRTTPDRATFARLAQEKTLIPVHTEVISDRLTPMAAMSALKDRPYSFLLESVTGGEQLGRYSFVGLQAEKVVVGRGEQVEIYTEQGGMLKRTQLVRQPDPFELISDLLTQEKYYDDPELPRFGGGAVGYVGYEAACYWERLPYSQGTPDYDHPDFVFVFPKDFMVFDHVRNTARLVRLVRPNGDPQAAYEEATSELAGLVEWLRTSLGSSAGRGEEGRPPAAGAASQMSSNMTKEQFCTAVERAKEYIRRGDIFQVVLSQRFSAPFDREPLELYRALRMVNPSPYMFYLNMDEFHLVGSSPEVLVRVEDGRASLRPIAGTRRRGSTASEDAALAQELLEDEKERAEHVMLVDLGRNDLGRVCRFGTVRPSELMTIERYSHVMHIVSEVCGELRDDCSSIDVLRSCFPAGTVSGAPKIRAMEIINELEGCRRGPYAGAVGYISYDANMDMCITIRTALISAGMVHIQAGAGIVADSIPAREYEETVRKAEGLRRAVELAATGSLVL